MKTIILFIVFLTTPMLFAQSDHYFYSYEGRIDLNLDKRYLNISVDAEFQESDLESFDFKPFALQVENTRVNGVARQWSRLEFNEVPLDAVYYAIIEALKNVEGIETVTPSYLTPDEVELLTSAYLYVKLNDAEGYALLEHLAELYQVDIINQNQFMPLWYTLRCNKNTTDHSLAIANQFYETGWFSIAEPDLFENRSSINIAGVPPQIGANTVTENLDNYPCFANDPLIDPLTYYQWAYFNDYRINICDAWSITEGDSNIIVAVLDQGIEENHPDINNLHPLFYDTEGQQDTLRKVLGNHGVPMAGIIGATKQPERYCRGGSGLYFDGCYELASLNS